MIVDIFHTIVAHTILSNMIPLVELSSNQMCSIHGEFALCKPHLQHAKALSKNILYSIGNLESENICIHHNCLLSTTLKLTKYLLVPLRS